jgi:hypothetical protein
VKVSIKYLAAGAALELTVKNGHEAILKLLRAASPFLPPVLIAFFTYSVIDISDEALPCIFTDWFSVLGKGTNFQDPGSV